MSERTKRRSAEMRGGSPESIRDNVEEAISAHLSKQDAFERAVRTRAIGDCIKRCVHRGQHAAAATLRKMLREELDTKRQED